MLTRPTLSLLLATTLLLTGCVTDDTGTADLLYAAPAPGAATNAHIRGSLFQESGLFGAKHVGYVLMVDQKFVADAEKVWTQPLALRPGAHDIAGEYRHSIFKARATLRFEAQAGKTYELRAAPGMAGDDRRHCDFSIVDVATGQAVTDVRRSHVSGVPQNRPNFRPLD